MTLQQRERELQALELDGEIVSTIVSGIDTARLHLLADAILVELTERQDGKPWDTLRLH